MLDSNELYNLSIKFVDEKLEEMIPYQVMDEMSPEYGGYLSDKLGFCSATASENALLLRYLGYAYCIEESKFYASSDIYERLVICINFQKSMQRESGFIDLRDRNYDSPPDSAFACSALSSVVYLLRTHKPPRAEMLEAELKPYIISTCEALANNGGFHTPNHRWVIAGAMSQGQELYPELNIKNAIYEYLNEGIDLNEDGLYSEKSFGYSAIINDKLMNVYDTFGDKYVLECIRKNSRCIIDMMNSDATVFTDISIRQDKGVKMYLTEFLSSFYLSARSFDDEKIWATLNKIIRIAGVKTAGLLYLFARHPEWRNDKIEANELPELSVDYKKESGIWHYQKNGVDLWVLNDEVSALALKYGDIYISKMVMRVPYYSSATFYSRNMCEIENGVNVTFVPTYGAGQEMLMPGYWKPLNRPVPFEDLPYNNLGEREALPRADISFDMSVTVVDDCINIRIKSVDGLDKVPFAFEFSVNDSCTFYTSNVRVNPRKGDIFVLTEGYATVRNGNYAITLGEGSYSHNIYGKEVDGGVFKIVSTDRTPIDKMFTLKPYKMDGADNISYSKVR